MAQLVLNELARARGFRAVDLRVVVGKFLGNGVRDERGPLWISVLPTDTEDVGSWQSPHGARIEDGVRCQSQPLSGPLQKRPTLHQVDDVRHDSIAVSAL